MGLNLARAGRSVGHELRASITWREYIDALSMAADPAGGSRDGDTVEPSALTARASPSDGPADVSGDESTARAFERALRDVRARAQRPFGLADVLELQCEAARLRPILMRLYARLGHADRVTALAREIYTVL